MMSLLLGALLLLTNGQSINFFSPKQDVEIGSETAKEADKLPLVTSDTATRYVTIIGQRISQNRSLPALRYRFKIVNSKDINSLGLPGGPIYIYRGLLDIASSDDEVAAILAHEVSHVASRHGTAQLSRLLLVQAPIAIAAGLSAADIWKDEIAKLGIALGIDAPFLRYSRDQELDASLMAVRLMADARFDPAAFRTLLEKVNEAQTAFVFNHPQSKNIPPEIAEAIEQFTTPGRHARVSADFRNFRSALQKVAYIPAKTAPDGAAADASTDTNVLSKVYTHPMDYYRLGYPADWQVTRNGANGAIIAPPDGIQSSRNGDDVSHGVMFDLFDISVPDRSLTLEQATNRLVAYLRQRNQFLLRTIPGGETQTLVSDEPGLRTVMIGKPSANGQPEVAWVVTRVYYQSLFYMVFVAPEDEFPTYQPIFEQIIRSVRLR